jgi:hypothetical protein
MQGHALAQTAASAGYECDFHGYLLLKLRDSPTLSRRGERLFPNTQTYGMIA